MWAQLITAPLKPAMDLSAAADVLKSFERPGSGLVREIFMQDQKDPTRAYVLAVFEASKRPASASKTHRALKFTKP